MVARQPVDPPALASKLTRRGRDGNERSGQNNGPTPQQQRDPSGSAGTGVTAGSGFGVGSAAPMQAVGGVSATGDPGVGDSVASIEWGIGDSVVSVPRERLGLPRSVMWALTNQPSQHISLSV